MERQITIKGIGSLKVPVDFVEMVFNLDEVNKDYKKGYELFESHISEIQEIIQKCKFDKKDLKTSELKINPRYEHMNKKGTYVEIFKGYEFYTNMKLCFDFDPKRLGEVFALISKSKTAPKVKVEFTVKDKEAVKKNLLGSAAKDAKEKADILCQAMGVKLGQLEKINYNWDEVRIYSPALYDVEDCGFIGCSPDFNSTGGIDYTPDDISVEDDACFIWEITE